MNNNEPYSVTDIVENLIKDFDLAMNSENPEDSKKTYRQKIYRALHDTGLWDKAIQKTVGKKTVRYFSEQQKQQLISSQNLYDYLRDNSLSELLNTSKRFKEVQKEIKERGESYLSYLTSNEANHENFGDPYISQEEFRNIKNTMMLTAIFELFFTPINDSLLEHDLYQMLTLDELRLETETIDAEQRLNHPEGNYYRKKQLETVTKK
ncbi:hypothetical protein DSECCO2_395700 [anaerobic digester metagenome]